MLVMFEEKLIDKLLAEEVNSAIRKIVDNYDLTGYYFGKENKYISNAAKLFYKYFTPTPEFTKLMDEYAQIECDNDVLSELLDNTNEKDPNDYKERLYHSLLDDLTSRADIIMKNREHLRIPSGNSVDFKDCMLTDKYGDKIQFYKDGGWGIAKTDGTVLIKNHLNKKPSETHSPLCDYYFRNTPYRIIQDRDTNKYGVLSIIELYEKIHCLYNKIEFVGYYDEKSERHFYIKAMKNGKWGCFDEKCALIIAFEYNEIRPEDRFIECIREADYYLNDTLEGKKDLYDNEGTLLIGGYDNLFIDHSLLKFCFTSTTKTRHNSDKSKYLVLDKEFKSIICNGGNFFRMPKWSWLDSLEGVERHVPSEYLFRYDVDLSHYYCGFIYLYNFIGEQYFVPEYILRGFDSHEEMDELYHKLGEGFDIYGKSNDLYVEDSIVTIIRLNEKKEIVWTAYANEVYRVQYTYYIYRKDGKVGFYDEGGLYKASYDAITKESPDGKIYVASYELCKEPNNQQNSINYIDHRHLFIHYYTFDNNRMLIPVEDDRKVFDPLKCQWLPNNFLTQNYEDCLYDADGDNYFDEDEYGTHYGEYAGTYAQDVAGYSDDVIDDAFDGDPDAYWNID